MTNVLPERIFALVAQWEYQCCGTPLIVGSSVDLTLVKPLDGPLAGPEGRSVEWILEHHVAAGPMWHVHARVVALWEWRVRREQRGDEVWYPVAGSGEFTPIRRMEVWDDAWQPSRGDAEPEGWAVELEVLSALEPNLDGSPYGGIPYGS